MNGRHYMENIGIVISALYIFRDFFFYKIENLMLSTQELSCEDEMSKNV